MNTADKIATFRDLHAADELFLMPNPWDVGSARLFASLGFPALATTSSGHAATLGRHDQRVTLDEMLEHASTMAAAVDVPINIDSERCFGDDPDGVADTVAMICDTSAAGFSIEDFDPATGEVDPLPKAVDRVTAAVEAARASRNSLVVTARAENHLHGGSFDDTMIRLVAFRDAGADVVYAPGLVDLDQIATVVRDVGIPVNGLVMPSGPTIAELASVGVRRVSTGGALTWSAYGAAVAAARELLSTGAADYAGQGLSTDDRAAFD